MGWGSSIEGMREKQRRMGKQGSRTDEKNNRLGMYTLRQ